MRCHELRSAWLVFILFIVAAGCSGNGNDSDDGGSDDGGSDDGDSGDRGDGDECCADDSSGAEDDDRVVDCGFVPEVKWHSLGEILQMESADGKTCVWLQREDQCPAGMICKAHPFEFQAIRIGYGGEVVSINEPAMLSWESTHHNWSDVGEATTATTVYRLEGLSMGHAYELSASGEASFGAILLEPFEP